MSSASMSSVSDHTGNLHLINASNMVNVWVLISASNMVRVRVRMH